MTRRDIRIINFQLLYMKEFHTPEELAGQLDLYFSLDHENDMTAEDEAYIRGKLENISAHQGEIDELLTKASTGWKLSRFSKVDLCILRLAVCEMLFDESIPYRVAINEAVELGKNFGGEDSSSFINGILGKIAKEKGCTD